MELRGRLALITGGAGGIGRAVAARLLRQGARVALWDVAQAPLDSAKSALSPLGEVFTDVVDITSREQVAAAAARLRERAGEVDVLDNNAGVVFGGDLLAMSDEQLEKTVAVNLNAVLWCTRAFLPSMIERGRGRIVLMSSASGLLGVPGLAAYAATKHAVIGLGESLRLELEKGGHRGVGVTIVCPSFVSSGMFAGVKPPLLAPWLTPEKVAALVVSAVESDRLYVRAPFLVKLVPALKGLAPARVVDWVGRVLGMHGSMDSFTGRA